MYETLNAGFFVFHTAWILFNCTGWIWRRTRSWHLVTVTLTWLSWLGLGLWYGWGYCPCTDWHWQIRAELGYFGDPDSYIQLLIRETTGLDIPSPWIDLLVLTIFGIATILAVVLNVRDWRQRSHS